MTPSYLAVSAPLPSAPSGPVALLTSLMHRRAVSARIRSSQSAGNVWKCLTRVVWSGIGSLSHGVRTSRRSDSIPRQALLSAIISRQAKSSFAFEWIGGRPRLSFSGRGHGFSRIASVSTLFRRGDSASLASSQYCQYPSRLLCSAIAEYARSPIRKCTGQVKHGWEELRTSRAKKQLCFLIMSEDSPADSNVKRSPDPAPRRGKDGQRKVRETGGGHLHRV